MRIVHWLFVVGAALFVFGIGFVVVGARAARQAPAPVERPPATPVATMPQIMNGIVAPAARTVFESVGTIVSEKGIEDIAPKDDREWANVGNSAAALAEAGNLMMMDGRAVDRGDWIKMSRALVDAGQVALEAVQAKDAAALLAAGEVVNTSCDNCHQRYQRQ